MLVPSHFQYNVAPTNEPDGRIDITIQLALFGIITMVWEQQTLTSEYLKKISQNEKDQTLTTNCEKILKWNDMFLRWPEFRSS